MKYSPSMDRVFSVLALAACVITLGACNGEVGQSTGENSQSAAYTPPTQVIDCVTATAGGKPYSGYVSAELSYPDSDAIDKKGGENVGAYLSAENSRACGALSPQIWRLAPDLKPNDIQIKCSAWDNPAHRGDLRYPPNQDSPAQSAVVGVNVDSHGKLLNYTLEIYCNFDRHAAKTNVDYSAVTQYWLTKSPGSVLKAMKQSLFDTSVANRAEKPREKEAEERESTESMPAGKAI